MACSVLRGDRRRCLRVCGGGVLVTFVGAHENQLDITVLSLYPYGEDDDPFSPSCCGLCGLLVTRIYRTSED